MMQGLYGSVSLEISPLIWYNLPRYAAIAQLVERIHGKDEVSGSTPDRGSIFLMSLAFCLKLCYNDHK